MCVIVRINITHLTFLVHKMYSYSKACKIIEIVLLYEHKCVHVKRNAVLYEQNDYPFDTFSLCF